MQPDPEEHGVLPERPGSSGHPGLCPPGRPHERERLPGQPEETLPRESHIREWPWVQQETLVLLRQQLWLSSSAGHHEGFIKLRITVPQDVTPFLSLQTYIGTLLVSVNPYKELDIYSKKQMDTYMGVNFFELPPHMCVSSCLIW